MRLVNRLALAGFAWALLTGWNADSQETSAPDRDQAVKKKTEEAMLVKALAGRRFWGDVHNFRGWRIQQNALTKKYQLIDPKDTRKVVGSYDDCRAALKKVRETQQLAETSGSAVVLIHGLLQSSKCMGDMSATLRRSGYTPIEFDYPSTQLSIPEAARYLGRLVDTLEGFDEINFVVHSMGGLVVRAYAAEFEDPRIKRMVMLGTPNRGSELADIVQQYWIFRTVAGPGGRQLRARGGGLIPQLPVPKFEFAVIAGSRGNSAGWNPFIPGDDDGTVTVASTRLVGAADFSTVNAIHSRLLWNEEAISQTVRFLKEGRLVHDRESQPIAAEESVVVHAKPAHPSPQLSAR